MVCRRNQDDVAGQPVNFNKQRVQNAFDLSRLIAVLSFFANRVKFVKKQDALVESRILEHLLQFFRGLSQIAVNDPFVTNREERNRQSRGDRFRKRCLAVSWRSG